MVKMMKISTLAGESFGYLRESFAGKWTKWILLVIATILLALPLLGYMLNVFRGEKPAPDVKNWGTLFIDGIKLLILFIIYAIPAIIIAIVAVAPIVMAALSGRGAAAVMNAIAGSLPWFVLLVIVAFVLHLVSNIGIVRFARTGRMGEAFNFGAIFETIGKIGWLHYILALIVLLVIIGIIEFICRLIPVIHLIVLILIMPFIILFEARYICLLYDSAGTA